MRHRLKRLQLNRFTSWHKATVISLAKNTLIRQSIKTTRQKAKATKPLVDKLIGLAKKNTLSAKRQAFSVLQDHRLVSLLFGEIAERFKNRSSGFVRILNLGYRRGDSADMVILELTEIKKKAEKPKKEKAQKAEKQAPAPEQPGQEKEPEKKPAAKTVTQEKPPITKKPTKTFLKGLKGIFKKERDALG